MATPFTPISGVARSNDVGPCVKQTWSPKGEEKVGVNIRSKGQRGEREAIDLIESWCKPVTDALQLPPVALSRNLVQSREGGYDVIGLDWLALEVKRHENLQVSTWWKQALRQAKEGQIPVLMYRQNRTPWRFRVLGTAAHYSPCGLSSGTSRLTMDLAAADAQRWLQTEFWVRMNITG